MGSGQSKFDKYREMARRPHTDPYITLAVERSATAEEIKKQYKHLAREHHPDLDENSDGQRFAEIAEAYSVLSDPEKRAYFDEHGVEGKREATHSASTSSDFDEFWERYNPRARYAFGTHRYIDDVNGSPHYHAYEGVTSCPMPGCPIMQKQRLREQRETRGSRTLPFPSRTSIARKR